MLGSLPGAEDAVPQRSLRAWLSRQRHGRRPCAHRSTAWLRMPASKVCLRCGSQHRPKHFNEGTYTVVTDCDSDLRDRSLLCPHLQGSEQPRLLSPTAKGHACLSRKRTHESTAGHSGNIGPSVQCAVIRNNSSDEWNMQGVFVRDRSSHGRLGSSPAAQPREEALNRNDS